MRTITTATAANATNASQSGAKSRPPSVLQNTTQPTLDIPTIHKTSTLSILSKKKIKNKSPYNKKPFN